jgi:mannose-6-phosphate isomerase class I
MDAIANPKGIIKMNQEIIKLHKDNNQALLMKGVFDKLPTWQNFIDHLNSMIKKTDEGLGNPGATKEVIGGVNFWHTLTMTVERPTVEFFPELENYRNKLREIHPNDLVLDFTIMSLTDIEPTTRKHTDPVDILYIQCIGSVVWEVTVDDVMTEYTLNPGDVIFVPSGNFHEIKSLEPRAAISSGWTV